MARGVFGLIKSMLGPKSAPEISLLYKSLVKTILEYAAPVVYPGKSPRRDLEPSPRPVMCDLKRTNEDYIFFLIESSATNLGLFFK